MPYVREQLKFNIQNSGGTSNNKPVVRQPSPFLYHGLSTNDEQRRKMEMASLMAKRDISIGKYQFGDEDLDFIPVKERKDDEKVNKIPNFSFGDPENFTPMVHGSFSPTNRLVRNPPAIRNNFKNKMGAVKKPIEHVVNIPTAEAENIPGSNNKMFISVMIDNLKSAFNDLKQRSNQKGYPDEIEQERLQRRVEEQRRHIYRMLYNTKRNVGQLINELENARGLYKRAVLSHSNTFSNLKTAYRSLMSGLNSFIRVSHSLHSTYMTDLKKKVQDEVSTLLKELNTVCSLLDIQIATLDLAPGSPSLAVAEEGPSTGNPVEKLEINTNSTNNIPGAPLSPERNESLMAAVKSLITAEISKKHPRLKQKPPPPSAGDKPKGSCINETVPNSKSVNKKKVVRPKSSTVSRPRKNIQAKRPISARQKGGNRLLGDVATSRNSQVIPASRSQSDVLEIHGNITPFITEREIARQAWIDDLGKNLPNQPRVRTNEDIAKPDNKKVFSRPSDSPLPIESLALEETSPSKQKSGIDTTMIQLLKKLEEIELEDEEIRSRWLHIQYSDPHKQAATPVVLPSADLLEVNCDIIPSVHCLCLQTQLADIKSIPKQRISALEAYRDLTFQYLRITKHFKTDKFDPWVIINTITNQIMESLMNDLTQEITGSCDSLANNIYMSEFLPS